MSVINLKTQTVKKEYHIKVDCIDGTQEHFIVTAESMSEALRRASELAASHK